MEKKKVVILGSTGSIGRSTLDVIAQHPERFEVLGLAAGRNAELLLEQTHRFKPKYCALMTETQALEHKTEFKGAGCELLWGKEGYKTLSVLDNADVVVSAMVGSAGLLPTLSAVEAGKVVALANKESLVIGGELVTGLARKSGSLILPVDSEHSAIFQCLNGESRKNVRRIVLTASGGPFWELSRDEMDRVSVKDTLRHPNWDMGAKITVDSATMMNKGLEVIEAKWLFDMDVDNIEVLVHRQSVVHSMVEFCDGSVMAQLGVPDMRIPIAYALSWPDRMEMDLPRLDLSRVGSLTFQPPDPERFPLLELGYQAARAGGAYPVALNAANEIAVGAFLEGRIPFTAIPKVVDRVFSSVGEEECRILDEILYVDSLARLRAEDMIRCL